MILWVKEHNQNIKYILHTAEKYKIILVLNSKTEMYLKNVKLFLVLPLRSLNDFQYLVYHQ